MYQALGFEVLHGHCVNVNPRGEPVEVDFSATADENVVSVALDAVFRAGKAAGTLAMQNRFRALIGESPLDGANI